MKFGNWTFNFGILKLKSGNWKLAFGNWNLEIGDLKLEIGNWKSRKAKAAKINLKANVSKLKLPRYSSIYFIASSRSLLDPS